MLHVTSAERTLTATVAAIQNVSEQLSIKCCADAAPMAAATAHSAMSSQSAPSPPSAPSPQSVPSSQSSRPSRPVAAEGTSGDVGPSASNSAAEVLAALPRWLQPGVSPVTHMVLKLVLFLLNALLASFAAMAVLSPHFEIMLVLSLALTASYFVFMAEIRRLHAQAVASARRSNTSVASAAHADKKQK